MIPYKNNKLSLIFLLLFFVTVLGYGYFEARNILYGPEILINTQDQVLATIKPLVTIRGSAKNIKELRMNGRMINVTEAGEFSDKLLLNVGYNKVLLTASDKFGRKTKKILEIMYTPLGNEDSDLENLKPSEDKDKNLEWDPSGKPEQQAIPLLE